MHFHKRSSILTLAFILKSQSPKEQSLFGLIEDLYWGL